LGGIAQECGMSVLKEIPFPKFEVKPDLVLVDLFGKLTFVDVSLVNPSADSYCAAASKKHLSAAREREMEKERKYKPLLDHTGASFVPFVCERYGGFGKQARAFLKLLARHARYLRYPHNPFHARVQISKLLQQGNAHVVRTALQKRGHFALERSLSSSA
jgi:hypothetical protein